MCPKLPFLSPVYECERKEGVVVDVSVAQRVRDVRRDLCLINNPMILIIKLLMTKCDDFHYLIYRTENVFSWQKKSLNSFNVFKKI